LSRDPDTRFQTAIESLEAWRALRPPGAQSVIDLEASGTYGGDIEDSPSSGEIKTTVLHKSKLQKRLKEVEMDRIRRAQQPTPQLGAGGQARSGSEPAAATVAAASPAASAQPPATSAMTPVIDKTIPSGPQMNQAAAAAAAAASSNVRESVTSRPPYVAPSENQLVTIPPPRSNFRTTATLVIGALVLASVGFGTVALVMHLMGGP
jgi:hypothetical protein